MSHASSSISEGIKAAKANIEELLDNLYEEADQRLDGIESALFECIEDLKQALRNEDFDDVESVITSLEKLYKDI